MILHYLGLDHIGHFAGPRSPLVAPKLDEMDDIVRRLFEYLGKQDELDGQRSLLVLCGDHGMSDQGSHGGASSSETNTPFVLMSHHLNAPTKSEFPICNPIFHSCTTLLSLIAFSRFVSGNLEDVSVNQIDMVPLLALMLGLTIPRDSLGILPAESLKLFPRHQQLSFLHANSQQLLKVAENYGVTATLPESKERPTKYCIVLIIIFDT